MSDPIENGVDIPALVAGLRQFADALDDVESEPEEGKLIRRAAAALEALTAERDAAIESRNGWAARMAEFVEAQARVSVLEDAIREALDAVQPHEHTPASLHMARILSAALAPTDMTGDESNE